MLITILNRYLLTNSLLTSLMFFVYIIDPVVLHFSCFCFIFIKQYWFLEIIILATHHIFVIWLISNFISNHIIDSLIKFEYKFLVLSEANMHLGQILYVPFVTKNIYLITYVVSCKYYVSCFDKTCLKA